MENISNETIKDINKIIYVYRYMWLFKDSDNLNIKVLSGPMEEHKHFISALEKDSKVTKATRVYLHEYDVNLIEFYEKIKGGEENEKNEK